MTEIATSLNFYGIDRLAPYHSIFLKINQKCTLLLGKKTFVHILLLKIKSGMQVLFQTIQHTKKLQENTIGSSSRRRDEEA